MRANAQTIALALALASVALPCLGATHRIASPNELAAACRGISPGDTVILADGTYTDQHLVFTGKGTEEHPVTLRAETPGKVILNGASRLSIGGEYLVVDGLLFRGGALDRKSIIEFRAGDLPPSRHCVLRNTAIIDYNPPKVSTRYFWVSLYGFGNTVENCHFSGQTHSGVTLIVWLSNGQPAGHTIRRNHFAGRPRGTGNGFETLKIGTAASRLTSARCTVAENLFEECDGELEIISSKSSENVFQRNTFLRCSGTLTLRFGNRCRVEENVFIGGDAEGAGGVRVTGEDHRVVNNFFSGTKGRAGGTISFQAGIPDSPKNGYFQVKNCVVDGNTFLGNPGALFALRAGYGHKNCTLLPRHVTISNNLLVAAPGADPIVAGGNATADVEWKGNVAVGGELGMAPPTGIQVVSDVPPDWKARTEPRPLKRTDVGPQWMREPVVDGPVR